MFEHKLLVLDMHTWTTRKLFQMRSFQRDEIAKQAHKTNSWLTCSLLRLSLSFSFYYSDVECVEIYVKVANGVLLANDLPEYLPWFGIEQVTKLQAIARNWGEEEQ